MNEIPCTSQNTETKTLAADVYIFGCFGLLSPAAVHSAYCWFDSGREVWTYITSIVTYLCKNSLLLHWNSYKQCSESSMLFLIDCEKTLHPLSTQLSHWQMFMQNGEYTAFWYLQLLCYLIQLQCTIGQNKFVQFFGVFQGNCWIWATRAFSIICVCTTTFKVSIPPLNYCFQWSWVWIKLINPLLCLNRIFPIRKQCFINTQNSDFSIVLKICNK